MTPKNKSVASIPEWSDALACGWAAPEAAEVGEWFVEEKAKKERTGLKSWYYFGKLLFEDKQAQNSPPSLRNPPCLGNCRWSLEGVQS